MNNKRSQGLPKIYILRNGKMKLSLTKFETNGEGIALCGNNKSLAHVFIRALGCQQSMILFQFQKLR